MITTAPFVYITKVSHIVSKRQQSRLLFHELRTCSYTIFSRHEFSTSVSSVDNGDTLKIGWKSWLGAHEYQPIWSTTSPASGFGGTNKTHPFSDIVLDNSSNSLLSQLDNLAYSRNTSLNMDIPTTVECNAMIKKLKVHINEHKEFESASHRAYLIWKKMEHCVDVRRDMQYSNIKARFHYSLPVPNRETYMDVLSTQSLDVGSSTYEKGLSIAPERALDVARKMEERYSEGNWDARVDVAVWNQVIATWANSSHPQKSYEAANILKTKVGQDADASSFGHVFKACATTEESGSARELAGRVALKVWDDMRNSHLISIGGNDENEQVLDRGSYMIVFALKAVQFVRDHKKKNEAMKSQFEIACSLGLVNNHVLLTLKSVATQEALNDILGKFAKLEPETIYHTMPSSWKRSTKANASGW